MKYFLIAGEASGDLHAAQLIHALKEADPEAEFRFLGGDMMAKEAGRSPLVHYRNMAYMGIIEVLKHLRSIMRIMNTSRCALRSFSADALILIDYPSFNLKMAKYAKGLGIPVFYYISPKVWAWKEYRVKQIKSLVDKMFCILPFEVEFYRRHDYKVTYCGNPSVQEIDQVLNTIPSREEFCRTHSIDLAQKQIVALLPGSRLKEISDNLPIMLSAVKRFPDLFPIIASAPSVDTAIYEQALKGSGLELPAIVKGDTFALVRNARIALVTSGTATLETALLGTVQVACYRMGGSRFVYWLYEHFLKVKFVTLPNLIADRSVIPELLLHHCCEDEILSHISSLLDDSSEAYTKMQDGYRLVRQRLGSSACAQTAAKGIVEYLLNKPKKA